MPYDHSSHVVLSTASLSLWPTPIAPTRTPYLLPPPSSVPHPRSLQYRPPLPPFPSSFPPSLLLFPPLPFPRPFICPRRADSLSSLLLRLLLSYSSSFLLSPSSFSLLEEPRQDPGSSIRDVSTTLCVAAYAESVPLHHVSAYSRSVPDIA
eukprot:1794771-Rhodomonas_salina.2